MIRGRVYTREDLIKFQPRHATFVGIDSDGCVFDTMEIKQKQCFHGEIIRHWRLEAIEKELREAAEFVNLYSRSRGRNRFVCLLDTFDLLAARPEVRASGVKLPPFEALRRFIDSGATLGNPALQKAAEESGSAELASVLEWSLAVNARVAEVVGHVPPFQWAVKSLKKLRRHSDTIVVSQTPAEALVREWRENGIDALVSVIAGQELGTKAEHIAMATRGRYKPDEVLMIGDAPGDMQAALANLALFYPVNPGHEEESWRRFCDEAYDRFLDGKYSADYQRRLVAEFEALLPETPPWASAEGQGQ